MRRWWLDGGWSVLLCAAGLVVAVVGGPVLAQEAGDADAGDAPAGEDAKVSELESEFSNYLHFVLIGKFDLADQMFAQPLLSRPELDPLSE